jgi:hypothetical protein
MNIILLTMHNENKFTDIDTIMNEKNKLYKVKNQ